MRAIDRVAKPGEAIYALIDREEESATAEGRDSSRKLPGVEGGDSVLRR